jgi:Na+-transporting methylmalonyl-CoA/oxaloacetate decarboxylase gamma subunit
MGSHQSPADFFLLFSSFCVVCLFLAILVFLCLVLGKLLHVFNPRTQAEVKHEEEKHSCYLKILKQNLICFNNESRQVQCCCFSHFELIWKSHVSFACPCLMKRSEGDKKRESEPWCHLLEQTGCKGTCGKCERLFFHNEWKAQNLNECFVMAGTLKASNFGLMKTLNLFLKVRSSFRWIMYQKWTEPKFAYLKFFLT